MLPAASLFTIVIATRNRPAQFGVALRSVLTQRFDDFDIVVVNDGSSDDHAGAYRQGLAASRPVRSFTLVQTPRGHGQSFARNYGAAQSSSAFIGFLDDDDEWTDPDHLARAAAVIRNSPEPVDLIYSDQAAFLNDQPVNRALWLGDMKDRLTGAPDSVGAYVVTPVELLRCASHAHLNITLISRELFTQLGGLDDSERYEDDRDLFLRALDRARLIKYLPHTVSRHNIPDPATDASVTTSLSSLTKRLRQLYLLDKAILFSQRPEIRAYAMRSKAYTLKHVAAEAARTGQYQLAAYYAREALLMKFALPWVGMTALYQIRAWGAALPGRAKTRDRR